MRTFHDSRPILGQDPHITKFQGKYILCESKHEKQIALSFFTAEGRSGIKIILDKSNQHQVWSPELHNIDGHWFIYYSSSDGNNSNHRMKVIGAASNPFGPYNFTETLDCLNWGIDMTVFLWKKKYYAAWSGWESPKDEFPQHLYIAPMISPVEIGKRVLLTSPSFDWELNISPINEGPQAFIENKRLYLLFSANASWNITYSTGIIELIGSDPLNINHWVKCPWPLMQNAGHGMIVEDSFIYHRKMSNFNGWQDREIVVIDKNKLLERGMIK